MMRDVFVVFEECRCAQFRSILVNCTFFQTCEWWHKSHGTSGGGDSFGWTDKFVGFMGATWGIPFSMLEGIWCKPALFIEDVSLIDLWSKLRFQLPCYQGVYLLEARINHCRFGDQDLRTDTASESQRQRCHGLLSEFDVSKRVRPETMNIHEYPSCTFLYIPVLCHMVKGKGQSYNCRMNEVVVQYIWMQVPIQNLGLGTAS